MTPDDLYRTLRRVSPDAVVVRTVDGREVPVTLSSGRGRWQRVVRVVEAMESMATAVELRRDDAVAECVPLSGEATSQPTDAGVDAHSLLALLASVSDDAARRVTEAVRPALDTWTALVRELGGAVTAARDAAETERRRADRLQAELDAVRAQLAAAEVGDGDAATAAIWQAIAARWTAQAQAQNGGGTPAP